MFGAPKNNITSGWRVHKAGSSGWVESRIVYCPSKDLQCSEQPCRTEKSKEARREYTYVVPYAEATACVGRLTVQPGCLRQRRVEVESSRARQKNFFCNERAGGRPAGDPVLDEQAPRTSVVNPISQPALSLARSLAGRQLAASRTDWLLEDEKRLPPGERASAARRKLWNFALFFRSYVVRRCACLLD